MSISHGLANKQTGQERNGIPITLKKATRNLTFFRRQTSLALMNSPMN
jgi:hypothetical protein